MIDEAGDGDSAESRRRAFLQQCGRFAIVTPPVVTLMLTVSDKAEAATSAKPTATPTTTTTPTATTHPTTTPPTTTPTHKTTPTTGTSSKTMMSSSAVPVSSFSASMNLYQTDPTGGLAMMIDSMGLMKL
jgi:hypothetical protein